ncbi:MAG TPA: hypothetical protein VIH57_17140 [Bacteroidales bacterium]
MKLRIILLTALFFVGIINSRSQTIKAFSISGGLGLPMGKTNYPKNNFSNAALFSNNHAAINAGLEFTFKSSGNWGYGILTRWNKYLGWKAKEISNQFANSSLNTFDFGLSFHFNVKRFTSTNKICRIQVVPFISYVKFTNPDTVYNLYSEGTINNKPILLSFQKRESISQLSQILPGIYVALEWSRFINEKTRFSIRPGLTFMLTKNDFYPDKYVLIPSITLGYIFDHSRNKWFFIKNS